MKKRFLPVLLSVLVLLFPHYGMTVRTAVFSPAGGGLKIVEERSSAHEMLPMQVSEPGSPHLRSGVSHRKSFPEGKNSAWDFWRSDSVPFRSVPLSRDARVLFSSSVLLLPKPILVLIFLQTVF
ncbi:hypothetical protein [Treponema saccharophilum]|uniref:hypothetical protein n=1 Tax=Treponema saccharophilum TaxID=165 RepID=UPI001146B4AE|nr:hypothetical protein [Treponema saccharophilum]